jgi:hypothetical protein
MQLVKRGLIAVLLTAFFILPFVSASWNQTNLSVGLVTYYPFNETTGTIASDYTGNGNNLEATYTPTWENGIIGNGFNCSGVIGEYIKNGSASGIPLGDDSRSMNVWFKPRYGSTESFFSYGETPASDYVFALTIDGSSNLGVTVYSEQGTIYPLAGNTSWFMATLTYVSGSQNIIAYYNGENTFNLTLAIGLATDIPSIYGCTPGWATYFASQDGVMDEAGIWNRSLTSQEVLDLYNSGNGLEYQGEPLPFVNTTVPYVTIVSPTNTTYAYQNILLNISSNGDSVWYNWNGANVSYTTPVNVSFGGGSHTLTAYANNSNGVNSSSVTFNVNIPIVCKIIGAGNYTVSGGNIIANSNSEYLGFPANVTASYSYSITSQAGQVGQDTITGIAGVTGFFPVIVVIGAMVVLILLVVLIINAVKGSGLVDGQGTA